ncbi:conserved exported hypothetical protein [uncultured Desulfobacterium sp.]|uniref:ABC transporter substrate binding protein n=1 Tax=uncultured Desulfobacterium sp. TaxID=201089 RepID=A0A445MRV8_9BACT|nr:conserved exported hypothetical protein [uncultured Desulfobacterium sp.]
MKKLFIPLISCLISFSGLAGAGQEIAVVQSIRVGPYEQAFEGVKSVCSAQIQRLVISETNKSDVISDVIKISPDVIVAIGIESVKTIKKINNIPIVYLMVLDGAAVSSSGENIVGVSMNIAPDRQLNEILKILPGIKTVGLLYDPEMSGQYANKVSDACLKKDIGLIAKQVHDSRDVPLALISMKDKVDVFWMIPDLTVVTPETVEILLLFSLENEIPLVTFSEKYAELGALMSIGIDAFDIGVQAGEMAQEILAGKDVKGIGHIEARNAVVSINVKVVKKLGITIPEDIISGAKKIE